MAISEGKRGAMTGSIGIVDGDPDFNVFASTQLRRSGHDVTCVDDYRILADVGYRMDCIIASPRDKQLGILDTLRRQKRQGNYCPVVIVSQVSDIDLAVQAIRQGASDFLAKPFTVKRLLAAVDTALRDSVIWSREQKDISKLRERHASLTDRQKQTMELLLQGKANKDIAQFLDISTRTVEVYRASVMVKMNAKSLVHLVRMGIQLDIE